MSSLRVCDREAVFVRAAHTRTLPPADMPADIANFHIPHTSSFSAPLSRADASGRTDGGTSGGEVGGRGGERGRGERLSAVWATNSYGGLQDGHLQVTCDSFLKSVVECVFWCLSDVFVDCQTPLVPPAGAALWEMRAIHSELGVRDLGQLRCGYRELCAKPGERRQGFLQWGPWFGQSGKNHTLNWGFWCLRYCSNIWGQMFF